jgi:hypothetical protein
MSIRAYSVLRPIVAGTPEHRLPETVTENCPVQGAWEKVLVTTSARENPREGIGAVPVPVIRCDRAQVPESTTMQRRTRITIGVILGVVSGCTSHVRPAQRPSVTEARDSTPSEYVVWLGSDTIMAERFTRSAELTEGDLLHRSPKTSTVHYTIATDAAGHITHFDAVSRFGPPGSNGALEWSVTGTAVPGGFDISEHDADTTWRRVVHAPRDAVPLFDRSIGLYEIITRQLAAQGADSASVPVLDLDSLEIVRRTVRRLGKDSVVLPLFFPRGEHARVDTFGHILGVSGAATSFKWKTESAADLDIDRLGRSFLERERLHGAFGGLSSRDTARAKVGGAHISINYGRPSKRGRIIFGGVVPWNEVWRTGADLATHLTTDHDLVIGGVRVPAGTYTLYTVPAPTAWQLIINRQTGQLGLNYDRSGDLGRVEMEARIVPQLVERLTITVDSIGTARGTIHVAWDDREATVPFTVLPAPGDASP